MLDRTSKHVRDCHARAADCRQRADAAADDDARDFWLAQEAHWLKLAQSEDLSVHVSTFLDNSGPQDFSPEAEDGVAALVQVFNRVCVDLNLDLADDELPRKIARTIILAALDGESDLDALYRRALKAVAN